MSSHPLLSIIIVNHKSGDVLPACLQSILDNGSAIPLEIIVVDNPPEQDWNINSFSDASALKVIPTEQRLGFGAACNLGAAKSNGTHLLFLNPDIELKPGAIAALVDYLDSRDPNGIAVGRLLDSRGEVQPSCRKFPTIGNLVFSRGSIAGKIVKNAGGVYTLPDYGEPTIVESAAAAMMAMSADTFRKLRGFDESFFLYLEDTDLCYRHALNGGNVYFVPAAEGIHEWGHSTSRYRFRRILWHHTSLWKYFIKHYNSPGGIIFLLPLLIVNCCLSLLVELVSLRS